MRTILVSGGYTGAVIADLSDNVAGLEDAAFRMALIPEGNEAPSMVDEAWTTPTLTLLASSAVASIMADDSYPHPAHYWVALDVIDNGGRHEFQWAMDPDKPGYRELVYLT